jgi:hypothetical protein
VTRTSAHLPALLASLAVAVPLLSACGSGAPSERDQIATVVRQEGTNPATVCDHLIDSLVARLGGRRTCLRQAASAAKDPTTHATSVRVHGTGATAVVVDRTGTRTITFVKQRGIWKISGVS